MPLTFTWELNPVTLLAIGGAVASGIRAYFALDSKADAACRQAAQAEKEAKSAKESAQLVQASLTAYQLTQAERLVSREVLRETEERLGAQIRELRAEVASSNTAVAERLDTIIRQALEDRRHR